jgi:hypothetical protein
VDITFRGSQSESAGTNSGTAQKELRVLDTKTTTDLAVCFLPSGNRFNRHRRRSKPCRNKHPKDHASLSEFETAIASEVAIWRLDKWGDMRVGYET